MFNRKVRGLCLAMALAVAGTTVVSADTLDEKQKAVEAQQAQTKKDLAEKEDEIDELQEKKEKLQKEIDKMDSELIELMAEIKTLKSDISDKEEEIEDTKAELEAAEEEKDEQYADMKTRIAYIYENGGSAAWAEMILSDSNITDLLNKAEYTQDLYDYDREALETYVETVSTVNDLEVSMEDEKAELVTMKEESEQEEKELNEKLEEKKATSANYSAEIKAAEKKADEYADLIRQQTAQIRQIQQQKAAQEAAARAAEAARRRAAAAAAATRQTTTTAGTTTASTGTTTTSSKSSGSSSSGSSGSSSSGSGGSVASYATQFVGNPYVWGGTSLTNGTDCSGFVKSVYAKYGKNLPHSSSALASVGKEVSYSEAKAGDIICYSGHVAIYLGNGAIVHASNEKDGIKISKNAAYRSIVSVRRVT